MMNKREKHRLTNIRETHNEKHQKIQNGSILKNEKTRTHGPPQNMVPSREKGKGKKNKNIRP